MSTLASLADEVVYRIGNRTDLLDDVKRQLNRALQTITQLPQIELLESLSTASLTSAADSDLLDGFPSDFYSVRTLFNTTKKYKLTYQTLSFFASLDPTAASTDYPTIYALVGSTLKIWPKTASSMDFLLTYRARFPELIDPGDIFPLTTPWEEVILQLATSFCLSHTGELERSALYARNAFSLLDQIHDRHGAQLLASDVGINPMVQTIDGSGS